MASLERQLGTLMREGWTQSLGRGIMMQMAWTGGGTLASERIASAVTTLINLNLLDHVDPLDLTATLVKV